VLPPTPPPLTPGPGSASRQVPSLGTKRSRFTRPPMETDDCFASGTRGARIAGAGEGGEAGGKREEGEGEGAEENEEGSDQVRAGSV
jgi:hypothetical protein